MARHKKIDVRMWGDKRFRALSKPQPNAQSLWVYLLTGPHTTSIPGLFVSGEAAMAESLGWPLKAFREVFGEVLTEGMCESDPEARVIWIPKAMFYNQPESPNVVKSWRIYWDEIPECPLKVKAYQNLKAFTEDLGKGFGQAFKQAIGEGQIITDPVKVARPSPNQEQEQEQEQEEDPQPPRAGASIPTNLDTTAFREAWDAWKTERAEKRMKPYTAKGERTQLDKLAMFGPEEAIRAIQDSIAQGYQGLFPKPPGTTNDRNRGPVRPNSRVESVAGSLDAVKTIVCGVDPSAETIPREGTERSS